MNRCIGTTRGAFSACATVLLLAGCGGSPPPANVFTETPLHFSSTTGACINPGAVAFVTGESCGDRIDTPARRSQVSPDYRTSRSLLFVTNYIYDSQVGGDVAVYDAKHGNRIAIITNGIDDPGFDCVDGAGTLYVPESGAIVEYALGQSVPFRSITHGSGSPADCTIDGHGNLWVATLSDVIEYLKGSSEPYKIISDGVSYANSVVFDHHGNMYVGNNLGAYSRRSYVAVYRPGRTTPWEAITDGISYPEGLAVDADDTLYVANAVASPSACGNIEEYRLGKKRPFRTVTDKINGPEGLTFADGRLYEDNGGINECKSNAPLILEFPLRSVQPSKKTISLLRTPVGIAHYPVALP